MKNKNCYLMVFILILVSCCVLSSFNPISNEQDDKVNISIISHFSASESHAFGWYQKWGGTWSDKGYGVAVDSSDNVYLAGYTCSLGGGDPDMILVKYDSSGDEQWVCTWEGIIGEEDYGVAWGYAVAVDSSDNVYLVGSTRYHDTGDYDIALVKYNSSGVELWNCTWGGSEPDEGYSVTIDSSDNVYITGYTKSLGAGNSDIVLVKYDSSGEEQWNCTWGGSDEDVGNGVVVDSLNNVYLAGYTDSLGAGDYDMVLVQYDSSGGEQWYRTWGYIEEDMGQGVAVDSSDNVYLTGSTDYYPESLIDMVLVKYNSSGGQQWNHIWSGNYDDEGYGVAVDSLNNTYLIGSTLSYGAGGYDIVVVKYDNSGVPQWNHTWGGDGTDYGRGIVVDSVDNIYLAGLTYSYGDVSYGDMVLVKYLKVPEIEIFSPSQNELFGSIPPRFNISVSEPNLHSTWYTLNVGGYTNIYFDNFTGIIDQEEWDKKTYSGMVTIKFYARDMLGRVGVAEISVEKDITEPKIKINSPSSYHQYKDDAPSYNIEIDELHLVSIWYTIDEGVTNYTITDLYGTINQEAWDAAPYDSITITFYANDLMGNIGYSEVDIVKVTEPKSRFGISGYPLLLFIGLLGLVISVYIKTRCKIKIIKDP
ncbi:MAG: SBBP repeat-containing protein [Promethearchaeota archaeon]